VSQPVLFIVGPTAVGKSSLALDLAQALGGEIISADSMQIYRGMDVGTAKPSIEDRSLVPHHIIDLKEPSEEFSAFDFCEHALNALRDIHGRGLIPILCGGTGFYIRALLNGLSPQPIRSDDIRESLLNRVAAEGLASLYEELTRKDSVRASRIHPMDQKRILRALEIIHLTGEKASSAQSSARPIEDYGFRPMVWGIMRQREQLYERINERVVSMFDHGLIN
jgi:tRNA dimethylallyltransferase